jgi:amino acid permease
MSVKSIDEIKGTPSTEANGTYLQGYTVLAKSMMGAGLLGIACACSKLGWVLGITFGILIPVISTITLSLIARVSGRHPIDSRPTTLYKLSSVVLGAWPSYTIEIAMILKTFGASIVYLQIAGDMLSLVVTTSTSTTLSPKTISRIIQLGLAVMFYPFCLLRNISKTFFLNLIGICCLLFIVVTSIVYFDPTVSTIDPTYIPPRMWPSSVVSAISKIPVYLFAYSCHQTVLPWLDDMPISGVDRKKADTVFGTATLTGLLIYTPVMILPFITFGSSVEDNFLRNLPRTDTITKIAYIAASVSVSISFPLQVLPLRNAIIGLLSKRDPTITLVARREKFYRYMLATIVVLSALGIAVSGAPLGVVMSVTGLVGGNTIVFLGPSWMYWKSHQNNASSKWWKNQTTLWWISVGIFSFSIILYPLCLIGIILAASGYS